MTPFTDPLHHALAIGGDVDVLAVGLLDADAGEVVDAAARAERLLSLCVSAPLIW